MIRASSCHRSLFTNRHSQVAILIFCGAVRADAFDDVFGFFGDKALRQRHRRDDGVGKADGLVADAAGEVDVPLAASGVVLMAGAVFLSAAAVVDVVQQVCVAEEGQGAEQGAAVDGGHSVLEVGKAEYA